MHAKRGNLRGQWHFAYFCREHIRRMPSRDWDGGPFLLFGRYSALQVKAYLLPKQWQGTRAIAWQARTTYSPPDWRQIQGTIRMLVFESTQWSLDLRRWRD